SESRVGVWLMLFVFFFFFFQAEDGIRDATVTGVQTCALPICRDHGRLRSRSETPMISAMTVSGRGSAKAATRSTSVAPSRRSRRSEERRVGKECRARWGRGG